MGNQVDKLSVSQRDLDAAAAYELLKAKLQGGADANACIRGVYVYSHRAVEVRCPLLVYALLRRDEAIVELLLDFGADPNVQTSLQTQLGMMPLHIASALGVRNSVRALLDHGAAPNMQIQQAPFRRRASSVMPDCCTHTRSGDTALHVAVDHGHVDVIKELLSRVPTDVNAMDARGRTALYRAIHGGQSKAVISALMAHPSILVAAGTSSALFAAIKAEDKVMLQKLLRSGASVHVPNDKGVTPLRFTLQRVSLPEKRAEISELLISAGADADASEAAAVQADKTAVHVGRHSLEMLRASCPSVPCSNGQDTGHPDVQCSLRKRAGSSPYTESSGLHRVSDLSARSSSSELASPAKRPSFRLWTRRHCSTLVNACVYCNP